MTKVAAQGLASREAVLDILNEHEATGAFLKDLFPRRADSLPPADRAFARELALGVLRHRTLLDHNIDRLAARRPGPGAVRNLLRLAAYQLGRMDVPAFAAVDTAVEIAKVRMGKEKAGFVNAVLKKLSVEGLRTVPGNTLKALATNHSHPLWLVSRWNGRLGAKRLLAALERNNQEAPLWIRVNPLRATVEEARAALAEIGVATAEDPLAPLFLRLAEGQGAGGAVLRSDLFARGALAFQDPAASLVADLAGWKAGESVLDLCAAPGGKSACLIEHREHREHHEHRQHRERGDQRGDPAPGSPPAVPSRIVCNDLSFRRLRRIRDARERLGHAGLLPVVMDPARGALRGRFDLVLVDAPCSNLGVIRRRPEARWSHGPEDLARLAALQGSLLASAADLAAPGGRIVYATCSPEPEETSDVVLAFLASRPDWSWEDAGKFLPAFAVKGGFLWLYPGESEYDGFFAARLVRKARDAAP